MRSTTQGNNSKLSVQPVSCFHNYGRSYPQHHVLAGRRIPPTVPVYYCGTAPWLLCVAGPMFWDNYRALNNQCSLKEMSTPGKLIVLLKIVYSWASQEFLRFFPLIFKNLVLLVHACLSAPFGKCVLLGVPQSTSCLTYGK